MILDTLKLFNFKNYKSCSLNFNPKFNFIFGNNGNGKTNILEAISLLCLTKSFLQNSETDCVAYGENCFDIYGEFISSTNTLNKVRFGYQKELLRKEIIFNNEIIQKFNGFFGTLPLVILSPSDLKLTAGTPNDKRRNFDILISQISKLYLNDLKDLSKIIKHKNTLLKENIILRKYSHTEIVELIQQWNEKLVEVSARIIMKRIEFLIEFQSYIKDTFSKIIADNFIPQLIYKSDIFNDLSISDFDEKNIRNNLQEHLGEKINLELARGISLVGPHRDNYYFSMIKNGENFELRTFASQGEHKTFIVAIKISEYHFLRDKLNNSNVGDPIILLDDLFSELDASRIGRIASLLTELNQVFLTTTDRRFAEILYKHFPNKELSSYYILDGTAQRIS